MKLFSYLDTSVEDIERLKEARNNINKGVFVSLIFFFITYFMMIPCLMLNEIFICIIFLFLGTFLLIIGGGLISKREIFSMMIYFKENDVK